MSEIKKTKPPIKKLSKPKINYQKKFIKAEEKIKNVSLLLVEQKRINEININDFQEKAKTFQKKAQKEVDKIKKELIKKFDKEKEFIKKYSSQNMLEDILETILNIEIAIKSGENNESVKPYVQGFKMLTSQLYDNLSSYGVKKITPKINEVFNPEKHYAVETKKGNKNKILEVKKEGFILHDRVIKPATVIIGK